MAERVERNSLVSKFKYGVAVLVIWLATPAAAQDEDLSMLVRRLTSHHGLSVDQLGNYLALGTPVDGTERRLVRWDQPEVTLGIIASAGVTADMIDKTMAPIESAFDDVGRRLSICIRRWGRGLGTADDSRIFPDCRSQPIEIDLVLDISERSIFQDIDGPQLPSELEWTFLRALWSRTRETVIANPIAYFCTAGVATDVATQKLVGGAGLIRPASEQNALLTMTLCSREMAYYLLGAIPIASPDGKGGYLDGDLLQLLYRAEFRSGETRREVLEKLRAASEN